MACARGPARELAQSTFVATTSTFLSLSLLTLAYITDETRKETTKDTSRLCIAFAIVSIASVHYLFMWTLRGECGSPPNLRYSDWFLTLPLMALEFALVRRVPSKNAAIAVAASAAMVLLGAWGERSLPSRYTAALLGSGLLAVVIYSIFWSSVAHKPRKEQTTPSWAMRLLIGVWVLYPIVYLMSPSLMQDAAYNCLDLISKGGLCALVLYLSSPAPLPADKRTHPG